MHSILDKYCQTNQVAQLLTVYIEEAHAIDEWDLPDSKGSHSVRIHQHRSINDRLKAASNFISDMEFRGEVVCDSIDNQALTYYDAYPERLYIVVDEIIVYKGGYGPNDYVLDEIITWLNHHCHM
jgi:hypothetical protein